jgi:hypothetical protein
VTAKIPPSFRGWLVVALTIARTFSSRYSSLYTGRRPIPDLRYGSSWRMGTGGVRYAGVNVGF